MTHRHLDPATFAPGAGTPFPRWRGALLAVLGFAAAIGFLAQISRVPVPAHGAAPAQAAAEVHAPSAG